MSKELLVKTSIFNKPARSYLLSTILICFATLICTGSAYSQAESETKHSPLNVVSDTMIAQRGTRMVEFIGNVKATQVDSVLLADSVKIYFMENDQKDKINKEENLPQSNVKKIISTGNVRYTQGERKAFADKAIYTAKDDILVLTGKSPKLITGTSFITGKKITLFRKQDKVIVESDNTKRVEALFNPEDNITEEKNIEKQ